MALILNQKRLREVKGTQLSLTAHLPSAHSSVTTPHYLPQILPTHFYRSRWQDIHGLRNMGQVHLCSEWLAQDPHLLQPLPCSSRQAPVAPPASPLPGLAPGVPAQPPALREVRDTWLHLAWEKTMYLWSSSPFPPPHHPNESPPMSGSTRSPLSPAAPQDAEDVGGDGGLAGASSLCHSWRAERIRQGGRRGSVGSAPCLGLGRESPAHTVDLDLQAALSHWEGDGVIEREQERGKEIMFSQCSYLKQTLNKDWDEPG